MEITPTPEQKEAYAAIVEAIGDALFVLFFNDSLTEDEDINMFSFFAFDSFSPEILETETNSDGTKSFTMKMTIPNESVIDIIQRRMQEMNEDDE
jgi:hypothetical protein